ncbi:MAG: hypothetical protein ACRENP_24615 [Longimicrobiales bacterium]
MRLDEQKVGPPYTIIVSHTSFWHDDDVFDILMGMSPERISEEEARRLWQRAVELQNAAEQAEQGSQALTPVTGGGFSLEQVSAAAQGAGIDPDYVRLALAEQRLPDAGAIRRDRWDARLFRWLMVNESDAIELTRFINAAPSDVLAAVRSVFVGAPFELVAENSLGADPLRDGVLVHRKTGFRSSFQSDLEWADVRVLITTLRPEADGTRMRIRAPLFRRGINLTLTGGFAGLAGAGGIWGGATAGGFLATVLGTTSAAVLLAPAVAGALAGGVIGVGVYRLLYRAVVRGGASALQRLMQAVALAAEK